MPPNEAQYFGAIVKVVEQLTIYIQDASRYSFWTHFADMPYQDSEQYASEWIFSKHLHCYPKKLEDFWNAVREKTQNTNVSVAEMRRRIAVLTRALRTVYFSENPNIKTFMAQSTCLKMSFILTKHNIILHNI